MIASIRHCVALLAMTKTGTTAVESTLAPHCDIVMSGAPGLKHMTLKKFNRFVRPILTSADSDIETVCVVREPLDWLGSWYRYRRRSGIPNPYKSTAHVSFAEFVEAYLLPEPPQFARVGYPSKFVESAEGQMGVDHLFRYEEFDAFTAFLETRFKRPLAFARRNSSPKMALDLPKNLKIRLETERATDFDLYERALR